LLLKVHLTIKDIKDSLKNRSVKNKVVPLQFFKNQLNKLVFQTTGHESCVEILESNMVREETIENARREFL